MPALSERLRGWARALKRQTLAVYFATRDPRTPWPVRMLALGVAAYALSPIDLIPDFIPVPGYLDDVVLVPLGIALVMRFVPPAVRVDAHARAEAAADRPTSRGMAAAIVAVWLVVLALVAAWGWRLWAARAT
jgi:uncharacterized membrane protein YkvA (DUF1232 family)